MPDPVRRWRAQDVGEHPAATIRTLLSLPDGRLALGSDYGLFFWSDGRFVPFEWPVGARREARRVEALAVAGGVLYVGTAQSLYRVPLGASGLDLTEPSAQRHGRDQEDGWDDLLALCPFGASLLVAWRTRLQGGEGPADCLCLAAGEVDGVLRAWGGTRTGELHEINVGRLRKFEAGEQRAVRGARTPTRLPPIRHVAFAAGSLWVAVAGGLHVYRAGTWSAARRADGQLCTEPTALHVAPDGALWAIMDGEIFRRDGEILRRVDLKTERPWCLAVHQGRLWVGAREAVWSADLLRLTTGGRP